MTNDSPLAQIADLIRTTNNGKLMIARIPADVRDFVPLLIDRGFLRRATFMTTGDAVRLP